jgi:hypothetical protein
LQKQSAQNYLVAGKTKGEKKKKTKQQIYAANSFNFPKQQKTFSIKSSTITWLSKLRKTFSLFPLSFPGSQTKMK